MSRLDRERRHDASPSSGIAALIDFTDLITGAPAWRRSGSPAGLSTERVRRSSAEFEASHGRTASDFHGRKLSMTI
jgi:hypothetical protein